MNEWMNFHHLRYFWAVAQEGGVGAAAQKLNVTQPAISAQLRALEEALGEKLFRKEGRRLALTDSGRVAFEYANEIFALGQELRDVLRGRQPSRRPRVHVGISDIVPKLVAHRLLEPVLQMEEPVEMICREDHTTQLIAALAVHELDVVITDAPAVPGTHARLYSHVLGESDVALFAAPDLARRLEPRYPRSLDGAPLLLPATNTVLRRELEAWFIAIDVRPRIAGEFDDSALMKVFGAGGAGAFAAPLVIADDVIRQYHVRRIGLVPGVREKFFAISPERKIRHPAVAAITNAAFGRT